MPGKPFARSRLTPRLDCCDPSIENQPRGERERELKNKGVYTIWVTFLWTLQLEHVHESMYVDGTLIEWTWWEISQNYKGSSVWENSCSITHCLSSIFRSCEQTRKYQVAWNVSVAGLGNASVDSDDFVRPTRECFAKNSCSCVIWICFMRWSWKLWSNSVRDNSVAGTYGPENDRRQKRRHEADYPVQTTHFARSISTQIVSKIENALSDFNISPISWQHHLHNDDHQYWLPSSR